jgi:hypothetical protein
MMTPGTVSLLFFCLMASYTAPGRGDFMVGFGKGYAVTLLAACNRVALFTGTQGFVMAVLA